MLWSNLVTLHSLNPQNGKKNLLLRVGLGYVSAYRDSTVKVHGNHPDNTKPPKGSVYTINDLVSLHPRVNPYQDRHALPLTPVVELKRLSAKWISNLSVCIQSVNEEGLSQCFGFNPTGQIDSSKHEFTLKSNSRVEQAQQREGTRQR